MTTYNGWKNYKTWNIALHINNDELMHAVAIHSNNYADFLSQLGEIQTPDGVYYGDYSVDYMAIERLIQTIKQD